jgi:hypothetical protein
MCQISIWGDTLGLQYEPLPYLKFVWFYKNSPSLYKSKFHPLLPTVDNGGKPQINGKDLWQTADHREKQLLSIFTCLSCGGADRRWKIGGITVPVAAASKIVISR